MAVDPKGYAGDPAYDGDTLLKSRALVLLESHDLRKAVHRTLDVFAEAAELDRERVQRWVRFHAVQAAFGASATASVSPAVDHDGTGSLTSPTAWQRCSPNTRRASMRRQVRWRKRTRPPLITVRCVDKRRSAGGREPQRIPCPVSQQLGPPGALMHPGEVPEF
ncbi:aminoglycoside phosphotransferase family protein [Kitasatospora sp. NPDC058060]|uniref:aminoglycoside phosphotransferase family protein n=1 Tax=Kitasatospora sp. NPDC058060 TaxID=3346318 RepID=UPI0036EB086C